MIHSFIVFQNLSPTTGKLAISNHKKSRVLVFGNLSILMLKTVRIFELLPYFVKCTEKKRSRINNASMQGTIIVFMSSYLFSILLFSSAADTITANQTLRDGETIVSARGEFEMGFFSPSGNTQNRYFGIWFKKISNGTVIWVADRGTPISTTSGILRVTSQGIVVSTDQTNVNIIWSSNSSSSVTNPVAQLLDTGNLVFGHENEIQKQNFMWQSSDHPVDNLLPCTKFGFDLATGIDRYFMPWVIDSNPFPAKYICRVDRNGFPQIMLWENSGILYRLGPWVGSKFSGFPDWKPNNIYTTRFVVTQTEAYYMIDLVNSFESAIARE